jgi:hypothetical protein
VNKTQSASLFLFLTGSDDPALTRTRYAAGPRWEGHVRCHGSHRLRERGHAEDLFDPGPLSHPLKQDGVVKVAHHGLGRIRHPDAPRVISPDYEERLREFLRGSLPRLADAPIVYTRLCFYCVTFDEQGDIIADIAEGRPHPLAHRFRRRPELRQPTGHEATRHHATE